MMLNNVITELAVANDITVTKFLDTTVTKFLDQVANDVTVTKFMDSASPALQKQLESVQDDIAITKYLVAQSNDASTATKFLEQASDDIAVTKYLNMSSDPRLLQYLQQAEDDIAVTKYLYQMYLESSSDSQQQLETTITKFLQASPSQANAVSKYLNGPPASVPDTENEFSVTKFNLETTQGGAQEDGIAVTKYLSG